MLGFEICIDFERIAPIELINTSMISCIYPNPPFFDESI